MRRLHLGSVEAIRRGRASVFQIQHLLRICYEKLLVCYGKCLTLCESILTIQPPVIGYVMEQEKVRNKLMWTLLAKTRQI